MDPQKGFNRFTPAGTRSIHTGEGVTAVRGTRPLGVADGIVASDSIAEYVGRGHLCAGNDDTCGANKAKGTDYCAGHLRKMGAVK